MPSVRVRRKTYSALEDGARPPLTSLFTPPNPQPTTTRSDDPVTRRTRILASNSNDGSGALPPDVFRRPPSKIHRHCTRFSSLQPIRPDQRGSSQESLAQVFQPRRTASPPRVQALPRRPGKDHVLEVQGRQADVWLRQEEWENDDQPSHIGSALSLTDSNANSEDGVHHHDDIVEHLDCIDPQVATVSNLTNAANALLFPPLSFYSRKPVVILSPTQATENEEKGEEHGDSLDRHVDDLLKRRAKIRRTLKGVWSFLKTPMGIITGIYGFLVVFWGAAIVIFLLKIINLHNPNTQGFWIEVSSQVTNGLFTVTGIGLIPSRALDTYRISRIWHFKRRTQKLRSKAGLPQLYDQDDLPDPAYDSNYVHVLTDEEQMELHKQQIKFQHNQTWYRAHGTETHRAFPINTALLICLFNDGNSFFQIILCSCMWSMNRFQRPAWTTGSLIPLSFLCGIMSAVFIWRGGQQTKRTEEIEEKLRAVLATEFQDYEAPNYDSDRPDTPQSPKAEGSQAQNGHSEPSSAEAGKSDKVINVETEVPVVIDEVMTIPQPLPDPEKAPAS